MESKTPGLRSDLPVKQAPVSIHTVTGVNGALMQKQLDSVPTDRVTSKQGRTVVLSIREARILMAIGTIMGVWTVASISYLVIKGLRAESDGLLSDARTGESKYVDFYSSQAANAEIQVPVARPATPVPELTSPIELQKTSEKDIQVHVVAAQDSVQLEGESSPPPSVAHTQSVSSLPSNNIEDKTKAEPTAFSPAAGVQANSVAAEVGVAEPVTPPQTVVTEEQLAPTQLSAEVETKPETAAPAMVTYVNIVADGSTIAASPNAPKSVDNTLPASVESFNFNRAGDNLVTHFSIRNLGKKLLTGTIIGEADFVSASGETMTILAEETFVSKVISPKEVRFYAPSPGKFTSVRFRVLEKNGKTAEQRQLAAEFPISL